VIAAGVQARRDAALAQFLRAQFGDLGAEAVAAIAHRVQWTEIAAGEALMRQGEPGDSAYLSVSGRLRVYVAGADGAPRPVRELGRGELIGEMSLASGEPRSATVVAIRDSVLARLDRAQFDELLARSPRASMAVMRTIIARLQTQQQRRPAPPPVTVALLPASAGVDLPAFAARLAGALAPHGRVRVLDAAAVDALLGEAAAEEQAQDDPRVPLALDAVEAEHDFVLLVAGETPSPWTRRCLHLADEVLLLADAAQPPALHPVERALLGDGGAGREAAQTLVLLHPAACPVPRGARAWLARRPVAGHVNLRPELPRDMARLARLLSRTAVGLVLGGGGARGFAHLGVWRALRARGAPIDCVGGTSIGAVMAALVAADTPSERAIEVARRAFGRAPTGDYNLLPLISLMKGRRLRQAVGQGIAEMFGGPVDIEDLWLGYFCVASNYSQGREERLAGGDLGRALLASVAIAGALPPVVRDGDLLCDGGSFNNFPVDAMREVRGVGTVIGVDLGGRGAPRLDFDEVPGSWALLLDRLRPRNRRRYRLPSLPTYLLNVTILYSVSRRAEAGRLADLCFRPPLQRVGLLQWGRFDEIVGTGERHAAELLEALDGPARARFGIGPRADAVAPCAEAPTSS